MRYRAILFWLFMMGFMLPAVQAEQGFSSGPEAVHLVELYTSEGCSSCPPADRWFSSLKQRPDLFQSFVPMAFHVDYWNYLGWPDRFARALYSQRQRQHAQEGQTSQVYTPGFVIANQEWRNWFAGARDWHQLPVKAGVLSATLSGQTLQAQYDNHSQPILLNIAYLGNGLKTAVRAGENRGRELNHDFVVLEWRQFPPLSNKTGQWQVQLPEIPQKGQEQTALVIWVSPIHSLKSLQATGGYLAQVNTDH